MSFDSVYDFIVIGAGSAGSIVADRLSADGRNQVLLLEAGGWDTNPWIHIPIGYAKTFLNKKINWAYSTDPEPELNGRQIYWPRGKVIGGSGAINGLVHIRGQKEDFDGWRQRGCPGWGWDDVLPYFKKTENHYLSNNVLHGNDGAIFVRKPKDKTPLNEVVIATAVNSGLVRNDDFNGEHQDGVGYYDLTVNKGRRSNSARGYLYRARQRKNLTIEVQAHVKRIVFQGDRAVAVEYDHKGVAKRREFRREVVLCAGAVNTPQLLMLSGVGPAQHLRDHGIEVVHAANHVGANLQDHLQARIVLQCNRRFTLNDQLRTLWGKAAIGLKYLLFRRGPMTYAAGQVGMFLRSQDHFPLPDAQVLQFAFSADKIGEPLHLFSGFTMTVCQSWPESRGEIRLDNNDYRSAPRIKANYLSAESDRVFFVNALRKLRALAQSKPLADYVEQEYWPGPDVQSDDEILDYVRRMASTIYHPCGTCRMGSDDDAVVDPNLRLRGVSGVRIADASVMPRIISGNINAACLMIGEKASDLILNDTQPEAAH